MKKNIIITILVLIVLTEAFFLVKKQEYNGLDSLVQKNEETVNSITDSVKESTDKNFFSYYADMRVDMVYDKDDPKRKEYYSISMFPGWFKKTKIISRFDLEKEKAYVELVILPHFRMSDSNIPSFKLNGQFYNYNRSTGVWTHESDKATPDSSFVLSRNSVTQQGYRYAKFELTDPESGGNILYSKYLIEKDTLNIPNAPFIFISLNFVNNLQGDETYEEKQNIIKAWDQHQLSIINSLTFN